MNSNVHIRKRTDVSDRGWRNRPEGKSTWSSCRAPGSDSQNLHSSPQDLSLGSGVLKRLMRTLVFKPKKEEVEIMINKMDKGKWTGKVTFRGCLTEMPQKMSKTDRRKPGKLSCSNDDGSARFHS